MLKLTASFASLLLATRLAAAQSVIAHYMAQQLYSYEDQHITADIQQAQALGIEAFVLNIAKMDYEVEKIQNVVYPAAERLGFKLLYSIDTGYDWTTGDIVTLVSATAKSNATYLWDGKPLLSSFSPSRDGYGDSFWADVKSGLKSGGVDVVLAPALIHVGAEQLKSEWQSPDGFMNWWAWPSDTADNLTTTQDLDYQAVVAERTGPYMMGVSPWQFKNLAGQAWIQNSDYLYKYRWEQAINEVKPDIVELITWNDYGESHYMIDINPIVGLDPDSTKYINGVDHTAWQVMTKYYISWFKACLGSSAAKKRSLPRDGPPTRITRPEYRDLRPNPARFDGACSTVTVTVTAGGESNTSTPASTPSSSETPASTDAPASTETPAPTETPSSTVSSSSPPETTPTQAPSTGGSCTAPAFDKDVLVWYFRIYPKDIVCTPGGTVPRNQDLVSDQIFAWAGLSAPATVRIDAGNVTGSYELDAGAHIVAIPFPTTDETPYFQIIRDGAPVVSGHATATILHSNCTYYDMNARVGQLDSVEASA
ncbi:glycosyl hydrolase family 71-domain-containing protein [Auriculariales sp. MPI-PUGE-AT-0066]|nr:glycosyl hydrolase family 71-domain-containing protein [Auriculariales sp. MPI-PUGE-AT-0066]